MALQKTITLQNGITAQNAYIKIDNLTGNKNGLSFSVGTYYDQNHSLTINNRIKQPDTYSFIPNSDNDSLRWDKQAYEFLKTLPIFSDAIDILEDV